ncbi:hypothetical protein CDAR_594811 [Caerostris darwini]|uniref:Uncharacterized protein n=1 Tax=Caerostris darwini TaxID=1538125 RepID=A0AAV4P772_9ARAC|nr:hypothetical protein CDAR_594811 [Caerostris darwini]
MEGAGEIESRPPFPRKGPLGRILISNETVVLVRKGGIQEVKAILRKLSSGGGTLEGSRHLSGIRNVSVYTSKCGLPKLITKLTFESKRIFKIFFFSSFCL